VFDRMPEVTHVIFAALNERSDDLFAGWVDPEQIAKNEAMLVNLFDPLAAVAKGLRHISIVHGPKAYGAHLGGTISIPFYEDTPRHPGDNFYHRQQDYIVAKQKGAPWTWTILRPGAIYGVAIGPNLSGLLTLAVYAALRKEAGKDLPKPVGRSPLVEPVDADLIAEALEWAAESPNARNEIFNLNNGDFFAMHNAIPIVAGCMNMKVGAPQSFDIPEEIKAMSGLWPKIVKKHNLSSPEDVFELLGTSLQIGHSWSADASPDRLFGAGVESTIKIRRAGFHGCIDSREMFVKHMRRMQELRMIPQ
jgi:nucleoside-diphosphate-sugar epimerase